MVQKILNTIECVILKKNKIREVLNAWNENLELDKKKFLTLTDNPLREFLAANTAPDPLRAILSSVTLHYNAFALIESPYLDPDFWESYSSYYSTSFAPSNLSCRRLHFFSGDDDDTKVKSLLDELKRGQSLNIVKIKNADEYTYRGYCILRPMRSYVIGRSAIEFDKKQTQNFRIPLAPEEAGIPFLKAKQRCEVNLLNSRFIIDAPEFIQQDPNLGRCATASLWVVTNVLSKLFGSRSYPFAQITPKAKGLAGDNSDTSDLYDPISEGEGMNIAQIQLALRSAGARPHILYPSNICAEKDAFVSVLNTIYSFVESGLPVLLGFKNVDRDEYHIVAIVGHLLPWEGDHLFQGSNNIYHGDNYLISSFIGLYYVHDDAYGPYNRIRFVGPKRVGDKTIIELHLGRIPQTRHLSHVILSLPPSVKCLPDFSLDKAIKEFCGFFCERESRVLDKAAKKFAIALDGKKLLWRSLLVRGSDFKHSLARRGYHPIITSWYSTLHLPKYVWLFEISLSDENGTGQFYCPGQKSNREIIGEYLVDATRPALETEVIAERVLNIAWDYRNKGKEEKIELNIDQGDKCCYECYTLSED